jgi:MarR-like DNA-binding transcriptional regulator SgrR of sgrS sRNA
VEVIEDEEATSIEDEEYMIIEEESTLAASQARRGSTRVSIVIPIYSRLVKQKLEEEEASQGLLVEGRRVSVLQSQRCSQHKPHIERTLRDTLNEEEIIYEDSEDGVNEQFLAEKQDLVLWNRSSSRPLRRSSQRVLYAMADDIESEEDQDDISIFEGSDKGVAIESDEYEFSDGAASSSDAENEPVSNDSDVEQVETIATATANPKRSR